MDVIKISVRKRKLKKANKTNINKIVKWSTSRHNEYRKSDVVDDMMYKIKKGKNTRTEYRTGAYSSSGHGSGYGYTLVIRNKRVKIIEKIGKKRKTYPLTY